jgi:catalase (peroxidase I)
MSNTTLLLLTALIQIGIVISFHTPMITKIHHNDVSSLFMSDQTDEEERYQSSTTNRRSFMVSTTNAAIFGLFSSSLINQQQTIPVANAVSADAIDYKAVANDIADIVKENPDKGPTLVRLAWHSSGTYDKSTNDGGSSGGTIRFQEELSHGGNAGLSSTAVSWLEPIHTKYTGLSYADLYTLGGGTYCF